MANANSDIGLAASRAISGMMEWGLYDLLSAAERRSMRLVCSELRHPVAALTETLRVYVDSDIVNDLTTAEAVALFHSSKPAAKRLTVCMR